MTRVTNPAPELTGPWWTQLNLFSPLATEQPLKGCEGATNDSDALPLKAELESTQEKQCVLTVESVWPHCAMEGDAVFDRWGGVVGHVVHRRMEAP